MRHMVLIRLDPAKTPDGGPDEQLIADMNTLIEEMTKAGVLLDTAGLRPTEEGTRIRQTGGKQTVIDGPFTESKEYIGGYCLLQTRSNAEAAEWASRFLRVHGPEWDIEVEVRQLDDQG
ncbi:transcriptional regulator [Nocardia sp. SYP-A9097]|uniref:YciI family protein n=1 Tax=Nocardia sp. SYP-A9097 TaxID=2663237 RepID=UPI00129A85A6|nr:YciI family protein [Nocardia sp. SYP-A9097]MRH87240.1 transcriptional regulator [Nocardia sp. SYP-A9097]